MVDINHDHTVDDAAARRARKGSMSPNDTDSSKSRKGPGRPRRAPEPEAPEAEAPKAEPSDIDRERVMMTLRDAAEYLNCHTSTLYRMVNQGSIPGFRLGGGWRFRRSDLDEWIASLTVVPGAKPMESRRAPRKARPKGTKGKPKR